MNKEKLKNIIEAALLASGHPLSLGKLSSLFSEDEEQPTRKEIKEVIAELMEECESRGVELNEVSSGYRYQAKKETSTWVSRLWEERPPRYSRALLETLALIAYRQPITRAEIEEVRGVSVSSSIIKTLLEREWITVVGHREVPGRPAMFGTTREFLDYFNLKSLDELPPLSELVDLDSIAKQLDLDIDEIPGLSDQTAEDDEDSDDETAKKDSSHQQDNDDMESPISLEAAGRNDETIH